MSSFLTRFNLLEISKKCFTAAWELVETRMHSSRIRTGRSLTVSRVVYFRRVCLLLGGKGLPTWGSLLLGGWYPSMHRGNPPPVNRITDTSKNITLATTSLRPVITIRHQLRRSLQKVCDHSRKGD